MLPNSFSWRRVWEDKSAEGVSDFELDRGISPRHQEIENLAEQELVNFIGSSDSEVILDTGCGTGVNILRLHSKVGTIIGIDYAWGLLERCQKRVQAHKIKNAFLVHASATAIPLPDHSVDRVLCLSVFQYLNDEEVRQALREFARVLTPGGVIVLHVKNLSSLYWSTLWLAKKLKAFLGNNTRIEYFRSFRWYINELASLNWLILDYNSFNLLTLDRMPKRMLSFIQGLELRHYADPFFRFPFVRRHGAELKIKARIGDARLGVGYLKKPPIPE
jgi:ubiquinone/menaquinone biosynthesis C-methylase UbiE